ncbi:MAG TPA: flagellar filament capping protein FliD [Burkholderiaceae bacterium]
MPISTVTGTGSLSSTGIGSGLDVESIVSKLVQVESLPIGILQTKTSALQTQLSSYGQIKSAMAAMRDAASKLTKPATWSATNVTSSDATAVTASAGDGAVAGTYNISVSQLAAAQSLASAVLGAANAPIGSGSLTIELGTWGPSNATFTTKTGTSAITINIAATDTLADVRDKINSASAGVTASIVTDSNGSRLMLRSSSTGESNGFRVTTADDDTADSDAAGLSRLAYDPSNSVAQMIQGQAAANAQGMLNGVPIESESNTLKAAIDGLDITLLKKTTADVSLTVAQDSVGIKKGITDFVSAYNALITLLRNQTKYDAGSKTAAPLQGDATAKDLQAQLRLMSSGSTTLGGTLSRLSDLGLDPGVDGTLTVTDSKLTSALGNLSSLKSFFAGIDSGNTDNNGLAQKWLSFGDAALGTDGQVSSRTKGIQNRIDQNTKRSAQLQDHVDLFEKRLRAQYSALDTQMASLNSLQNYITQQITQMNKST